MRENKNVIRGIFLERKKKLKKYILTVIFILVFPVIGFAKCCDYYQNKKGPIIHYYPRIPTMRGTTTELIVNRSENGDTIGYESLRNDGIKKLIGKMVRRTKPCMANNYDRSYMSEPRKLLAVTDRYLILSSDILAEKKFEIERNEWDDGNWEEWRKPKRLSATEMIGTETFHTISYGKSQYHCVVCGGFLRLTPIDHYCLSCKTGWDVKEE